MKTSNSVPIGMHQGSVMMRLAKHYADLVAVLLEIVQNAIDSGASKIHLDINVCKRCLSVKDNGKGADIDKVVAALQSIGSTLKDKHQYGQFGLGLIAPLSIAKRFDFISCPESDSDKYTRCSFVSADIVGQRSVAIPIEELDLHYDPDSTTWWRTFVNVSGITKDRRTTTIDLHQLCGDIAMRFGEEIRRRKIDISVDLVDANGKVFPQLHVEAPEFTGEKLEVYAQTIDEVGKVSIELFLARLTRSGRKGNIVFGNTSNPSRITAKQFVHSTSNVLKAEVGQAILSGVFEGSITCDKVKMHADRTKFEDSDACVGLCAVLEVWYETYGKAHIEAAKEAASDDRFQRIAMEVMPFAEKLLKQPDLKSVFGQIVVGTVGDAHIPLPPNKIIGQEDEKSIIAVGKGGSEGKDKSTSKGKASADGHPQHRPNPVYGPRGRRRTEVKSNSTGLRFAHVEFEDFRVPYVYEPETGTLSFNMRHSNWGFCSESDAYLRRYHVDVVISALSLELTREGKELDQKIQKFAWDALALRVFAILNDQALIVRK